PVDEREPVRHHRRRDAADEEKRQGRLDGARIALHEAREDVERDRHELEGEEEKNEVTRRDEHAHAEQRREQEQVVLARTPREHGVGRRQSGEHADERGDEEQALGEERQSIEDEHSAQRRRARGQRERRGEQHADPDRGNPPEPAPILAAPDDRRAEYHQEQRAQAQLHAERRHGLTILASSGTGAESTGPSAVPGAMPKSTRTKTRMTIAAHSGPRASARS